MESVFRIWWRIFGSRLIRALAALFRLIHILLMEIGVSHLVEDFWRTTHLDRDSDFLVPDGVAGANSDFLVPDGVASANRCSLCCKSFKRLQDLKIHNMDFQGWCICGHSGGR